MSENYADRLEAIMARKQAKDRAIMEARDAESRKAAEEQARRGALKKNWQEKCFPMILQAVKDVNDQTNSAGISINALEEKSNGSPAIARVNLFLFLDGRDSSKKITINVTAIGNMQIQEHFPISSPVKAAHIDTLSEKEIKDIILDFLETAIEK